MLEFLRTNTFRHEPHGVSEDELEEELRPPRNWAWGEVRGRGGAKTNSVAHSNKMKHGESVLELPRRDGGTSWNVYGVHHLLSNLDVRRIHLQLHAQLQGFNLSSCDCTCGGGFMPCLFRRDLREIQRLRCHVGDSFLMNSANCGGTGAVVTSQQSLTLSRFEPAHSSV